jgi:hypothetical protein
MKKQLVIRFGLFFVILSGLISLFFYFNQSFNFSKIVPFTQENVVFTSQSFDPCIVNQKFFYLGKGAQVFVFLSQDEKHVLKIYRFSKYQESFLSRFLTSIFLKTNPETDRHDYNRKFSLESYPIADHLLRPITEVEYVHLNHTNHLPKIVLHDWLKKEHVLDLNDYIFIIQKKADPLKNALLDKYLEKDYQTIRHWIASYGKTLIYRIQKQIGDRDFINALRNAGVYQDKVILMDVGGFYNNPILKNQDQRQQEINITLKNLEDFIDENMPSIKSIFIEEKEKILQEIDL